MCGQIEKDGVDKKKKKDFYKIGGWLILCLLLVALGVLGIIKFFEKNHFNFVMYSREPFVFRGVRLGVPIEGQMKEVRSFDADNLGGDVCFERLEHGVVKIHNLPDRGFEKSGWENGTDAEFVGNNVEKVEVIVPSGKADEAFQQIKKAFGIPDYTYIGGYYPADPDRWKISIWHIGERGTVQFLVSLKDVRHGEGWIFAETKKWEEDHGRYYRDRSELKSQAGEEEAPLMIIQEPLRIIKEYKTTITGCLWPGEEQYVFYANREFYCVYYDKENQETQLQNLRDQIPPMGDVTMTGKIKAFQDGGKLIDISPEITQESMSTPSFPDSISPSDGKLEIGKQELKNQGSENKEPLSSIKEYEGTITGMVFYQRQYFLYTNEGEAYCIFYNELNQEDQLHNLVGQTATVTGKIKVFKDGGNLIDISPEITLGAEDNNAIPPFEKEEPHAPLPEPRAPQPESESPQLNISSSLESQERELQEQEKQLQIIQECKQKIFSFSELTSSDKRMLDLKLDSFYANYTRSLDVGVGITHLLSEEYVETVEADYNKCKNTRELEKIQELISLMEPIKANFTGHQLKRSVELFEVNLQNYLKRCEELQEEGLSSKNLELLQVVLWDLHYIESYKDVRDRISKLEKAIKPIEAVKQNEDAIKRKNAEEQRKEEEKEKKLLAEQYAEHQKRLMAKCEKYGAEYNVMGQQLTANPFKYEGQVVVLSLISFERMLDRNTGTFDDLKGHQLVVANLPSNLFTRHGQLAKLIVKVKGATSVQNAFGATFEVPLVEYIDLY